ncbi:MAG: cytochrome c-type biogenesis protein CcmH [Hyphomicrobiaceae bacterium]
MSGTGGGVMNWFQQSDGARHTAVAERVLAAYAIFCIGSRRCGMQMVTAAWVLACGALLVVSLLHITPANALSPAEQLKNTALEDRARELSAELRCLVCQNQSIDDSDAPLAKDLRRIVRERIVAGDTNAQVKSFLVERYGDFVLLKPPFNLHTLLLWLTPLLVLGATLLYVVPAMRRSAAPQAVAGAGQTTNADTVTLSAQEEARLAELMKESGTQSAAGEATPGQSQARTKA